MCVLHVAGITMYAVGVGKAVEDELREIASEPMEKHFFYTADFTAISQIAENLKLNVCAGAFERLRTHTIPESHTTAPSRAWDKHTCNVHMRRCQWVYWQALQKEGGGWGVVGGLGAPLSFFKIIHKCPSRTNSNDIVINKRKCIWVLINMTICTKQYSSKVWKFLFIFTYLSIWGVARLSSHMGLLFFQWVHMGQRKEKNKPNYI